MDPNSSLDICLYLGLALALMLLDAGPIDTLVFLAGCVPFLCFTLPARLVSQYMLRSYDERSAFARHASVGEAAIVECVGWSLDKLDPGSVGRVFYSQRLALWFFLFRKFQYGSARLGDTGYSIYKDDEFNGLWIRSSSRPLSHDIVVYYIHGGGFSTASVFFYLEYLETLLVALQMQGFRNPAIFAIDYAPVPTARFSRQLTEVALGWNYLCSAFGNEMKVVAGDSTGATLALSLLLHIARPYPDVPQVGVRPDAAVLVSPWTKLFTPKPRSASDYLTQRVLSRYAAKYLDPHCDELDVYHNPGLCRSFEWWTAALPEFGTYICYGSDELLAADIEEFALIIHQCGRVAIEAESGQIHAWPVVMNYVGATTADREAGVDVIASNLAKMLLWASRTGPGQ